MLPLPLPSSPTLGGTAYTQEPDDPEFSLPDRFNEPDPDTARVAAQRHQAAANGDPVPTRDGPYDRVRVRDWE